MAKASSPKGSRARKGAESCMNQANSESIRAAAPTDFKSQGVKKVVLAYSGGLDTSVIIRWLIENYGCEVIAFTADLGQGEELKPLKKKALATGASKFVLMDLRKEFVEDFIVPAIKANALYEGKYPMATSLGRPLIAKHLIQVAQQEGADAIGHGCTGKGNDQCRFEFTTFALDPSIRCLAPVREWELKTREEEIEYAKKYDIPVTATKEKPYSLDKNLYGCSIECGVLEDPWNEPPEGAWQDSTSPLDAPDQPEEVTISFTQGVPTALNGKAMHLLTIIEKLSAIGHKHGVGRIDLVENRLVGIKSREVYEAPASMVLILAHKELETLCLDRETARFKETVSQKFTDLIYNGWWYSPLRESLQVFLDKTQENVTGDVVMRLYKGSAVAIKRRSPNSLYDKSLATYEAGDQFRHDSAFGFIDIFGLPLRVLANVKKRQSQKGRKKS